MAIKTIKDLEWQEDDNGIVYSIAYQIHNSDYNDYKDRYPRNASADDWTLGYGTYLANTVFKRKAQHWQIFLKAYSRGYESTGGLGSITQNDSMPKAIRAYDVKPFDLPASFWGIRPATQTDVNNGIFRIAELHGDSSDQLAVVGNWVYNNVTATEKTGSANFSQCPFDTGSELTISNLPLTYFNKKINTMQYTVEFYSRYDIDHFDSFEGVNGSFATSKTRPSLTTSKAWVAQRQVIKEIINDNKRYTHVIRVCLRAPKINGTQMLWNTPTNTWEW